MKTIKTIVAFLFLLGLAGAFAANQDSQHRPPNVVLIFADDLGYGDLGCYGHPTIATPNLDRMAQNGQRWTQFYAGASVCTPSRAALLTGKYAIMSGTHGDVYFEWSASGLAPEETTLAESLKGRGYATACIGKWHLGHGPDFLPTRQGFDAYFGIPYSNDMRVDPEMKVAADLHLREGMTMDQMRDHGAKVKGWVPLMRDDEVIEYPCDQETLTKRYTEACLGFIRENREKPFFLYYAQSFPHVPLHASDEFRNTSERGLYGDVVEEMDASVGAILQEIERLGISENTLVIFTSDNGPWLSQGQHGGSAGLLRAGKATTYEGGVRVPAIFYWPGKIQPGGVMRGMGTTLDLYATLCNLAGAKFNAEGMDSHDLSPSLIRGEPSTREIFFYYRKSDIFAIRHGQWKAHFVTQGTFGSEEPRVEHTVPLLYHLGNDPSEKYDIAAEYPEVVDRMRGIKERQEREFRPAPLRFLPVHLEQVIPDWFLQRYQLAN